MLTPVLMEKQYTTKNTKRQHGKRYQHGDKRVQTRAEEQSILTLFNICDIIIYILKKEYIMNERYPSKISIDSGEIKIVYEEEEEQLTQSKVLGVSALMEITYESIIRWMQDNNVEKKEVFAKRIMKNIQLMDNSERRKEESDALAKTIAEARMSIEGGMQYIRLENRNGSAEQTAACIAFIIKTIETIENKESGANIAHIDRLITKIAKDSLEG